MAKTRKDSKGYALRTNEYQRENGRYQYTYKGWDGKRHSVYAKTLVELRKLEKKIERDIDNKLDPGAADRTSVNELFDLYISQAKHLSPQTRFNYTDMYNRHVRQGFGMQKVSKVHHSDIKKFYYSFLEKEKTRVSQKGEKRSLRSLENLHTPLFCAFEVGLKDGFIERNPCKDALKDVKKSRSWKHETKKREALTREEQRAFMNHLRSHDKYAGWLPIMTVLFGTGMRIGECLALRWEDIDWDEGMIHVNLTLSNREFGNDHAEKHVGLPKTNGSIRQIPMHPAVREALMQEYEYQSITGFNKEVIDGYSGFIFVNANQKAFSPPSLNRFIKRAYTAYNDEEMERAKKEDREPLLIPHFSCHITRHTFCTRCVEEGIALPKLQKIMGHAAISTTIDIYNSITEKELQCSLDGVELNLYNQ